MLGIGLMPIDGDARLRQLQADLVEAEIAHDGDKIWPIYTILLRQNWSMNVEAKSVYYSVRVFTALKMQQSL